MELGTSFDSKASQIPESQLDKNGRVVRWRIFQTDAQKVAQGEGVRSAPRDAALRIDPFEIANQQQPEVHAWRQARPSHDFGIKMIGNDLRRNHRSGARPAADSIACRMGDWRPLENPSS